MEIFCKKITAAVFCAVIFSAAPAAIADAQELMVGGQAVGIQLSTEGVIVAGISEVETETGTKSPSELAGVKKGDSIICVQGEAVSSAADIISRVDALSGAPVCLTVKRGGKTLDIEVQPVQSCEGKWAIGLWLRDGVGGIGTLTFFDPETGVYGALGHSVSDSETGEALPMSEGSITDAQIVSVKKGVCGQPGELNGCADFGQVLGSIDKNTVFGIFGQGFSTLGGKTLETGTIRPGPATILSTLNGREIGEYSVEINRICRDSDGVHAMLSVTDSRLIERTGGIVQGMSGSPIIQGGCLVGAVTHV